MKEAKLLLVGSVPPPINGQSMAMRILIKGLQGRGVSFEVIDNSARFARRSSKFSFRRSLQLIGIAFASLWKIARAQILYVTVAQSLWGLLRDLPVITVAALLRRRIVLHIHGGNYQGFYDKAGSPGQRLIMYALDRADRIIVLSEGLRSQLDFAPHLAERVEVVPNTMEGFPSSAPERGAQEAVRVLFLSNLLREKGYFQLLQAAAILQERGRLDEFTFKFAGQFQVGVNETLASPKAMEEEARAFIANQDLASRVDLLGVVQGDEKTELLRSSDLMVLPSAYINEGQPISVIEGLAHGNWILTTSYRGLADMIIEGEHGRFVGYNDAEDLANRLEQYLDVDRLAHDRIKNHRWAKDRFDPRQHVELMLDQLMTWE